MKLFKDRQSAGKLLANRLKSTKADLVLGIPRGGVVVAAEIAKSLKLPLDIIVTRKIGAPMQEELALGAVDPDGECVWEKALLEELRIKNQQLREEIKEQWKELKRREDLYRPDKKPLEVQNKVVILVDDGMATGATTLAAIKYLKRHRAKVILVVPVASKEAWEKVSLEADQAVILDTPDYFQAVGQFYYEFDPVTDEEVVSLLT